MLQLERSLVNKISPYLFFCHFEFEKLIKKGFVLEQVDAAFEYAVSHNPFRVSIDLT